MRESWKPIKDFPYHAVSNIGNVRSYIKAGRRFGEEVSMVDEPYIMSGTVVGGYIVVNLTNDEGSHFRYVHRLVAEAFIPNPLNRKEINHKNGDKADNRASNIEWSTRSENIAHAYRNGLKLPNRAKVTPEQVIEMREKARKGRPLEVLADEYGLTVGTVRRTIKRKLWRHI